MHIRRGLEAHFYLNDRSTTLNLHLGPVLNLRWRCANDEQLEVEVVLAGHVMGLLTSVTATAHIRTGRLVPQLTVHVTDHLGVYVYYGSC